MAQYAIPDPEEMMECPYDKTHMVSAKGFQTHLIKCRKNNPGKDFERCPFNALHEMPKKEYRCHLAVCPDKAVLDRELDIANRKDGDIFKGCTETPIYMYNDWNIPSTEDWDSEVTESVSCRPLFDNSYYSRVPIKTMDRTMSELNPYQREEEELRLPKTSSTAARTAKQIQPRQQPESSVFAYHASMGCGWGRGAAPQNNANSPLATVTVYQRTPDSVSSEVNRNHLQSKQAVTPLAVTIYQRTPDIASSELNRNHMHCFQANRNDGDIFKGCTKTPVYMYNDWNIPSTEDWDSDENTAQMGGFGCGSGAPPPGFRVPNMNNHLNGIH